MTLVMRDQENQEIGKKIGETRVRTLVEKLIADGRYEDIEKMVKDEEYLQELYEEYGII
ncbi:MAG TPA: hypothetical protein IAB46_13900 [Candidatus Scybalocola faecigallinarum]|uniref:Uncharacterized protein n=1 Tax=Candidatus Scybalocola faecigallinarum TaxID=2840941 RepID=A0A9D1F7H3_9FIRM|nr:hypothetical protein [Candidatus Scybalocola faecigallinarum]